MVLPMFGRNNFAVAKADEEINTVYVECEDETYEGKSYNPCYTKILTYENISSLSVEVHFDSSVFSITSASNRISATMEDHSINEDYISFTYIFSTIIKRSALDLFFFTYSVKPGAPTGRYFFDVIVSEAVNGSLEDVNFVSQRKYVNVVEPSSQKSALFYPRVNKISTAKDESFTINYSTNSLEPSSGRLLIQYDKDLFEFVSLTEDRYFQNTIFDYNASVAGEISISFIDPNNAKNSYDLLSVTFNTIANIDIESNITIRATELFDSQMQPMTYTNRDAVVTIVYDSNYEDKIEVYTTYEIDKINHQVTLSIVLEEDSHLGAGDFVLSFDKEQLSYVSYEKKFSPTMFGVNDKPAQLENGQIRMSILSMTDIVEGTELIEFVFNYTVRMNDYQIEVELVGTDLTDSLTNPIDILVSGTSFTVEGEDLVLLWANTYLYMNNPSFEGEGSGRCVSDNLYETAKRELFKLDDDSIDDFASNAEDKYTLALARYLAWASANGDNKPFENNYDFMETNAVMEFFKDNNVSQNSLVVIICTLSFVSLFAISAFLLKRKEK